MNVLQRASSIRGVRELSNEEVRRLEMEWNGVFTKLGVLQGQLKSRRKRLAGSELSGLLFPSRLFRRPAAELPDADFPALVRLGFKALPHVNCFVFLFNFRPQWALWIDS